MQRQTYRATIERDGETIGETTKYAWNSALRATEAMVRELARSEGQTYSGGEATRVETRPGTRLDQWQRYTREWSGDRSGRTVTAIVERVS